MYITVAGYLYIPIVFLISFLCEYKKTFLSFIIACALTTISVISIGNNNVLLYQIFFIFIVLKYLKSENCRIRCRINLLFLFLIYAALSLPFSYIFQDINIPLVDGGYGNVEGSFQQITQYAYLVIGYIVYYITRELIAKNKIDISEIEKTLVIALGIVMVVGWLQTILPLSLINTFFRNSSVLSYNYEGARISSTFQEPSMLALFMTPLIALLIYSGIKEAKKWRRVCYVLILGGSILLMFKCQASSFYIGIIAFVMLLLVFLFGNHKLKRESTIKIIFVLLIYIVLLICFREQLGNGIYQVIIKLSGSSESHSGTVRMRNFLMCFNAFKNSSFLGVGYGTLRGTDWFSTLLAEVGIVGSICFFGYIINLLYRLLKLKTDDSHKILVLIVVSMSILLISVPEIYILFIWIYFGMGDGILIRAKNNKIFKE